MSFNTSSYEIEYFKESPIECYKLKLISGYLLLLFFLGVAFNTILIFVFMRNRSLITPLNLIIITMIVFNLIGGLFEFPVVILSNFNCRYIKNHQVKLLY